MRRWTDVECVWRNGCGVEGVVWLGEPTSVVGPLSKLNLLLGPFGDIFAPSRMSGASPF